MILSPLIENSVRHAVAVRNDTVLVEVTARQEGDYPVLSVTDTGRYAGSGRNAGGFGIGLTGVCERLAALFGPDARKVLAVTPEGFSNELRIPVQ